MLSSRGEVAANLAEHFGALFRAKAAGNLLFDLDHADVSFGLGPGCCQRAP